MRTCALALLLAALTLPAPAAALAQDVDLRSLPVRLDPDVAAALVEFFNAPSTTRFTGKAHIAAQSTVRGNVAVLDGPLTLAGRVEGDVVVLNGDIEFLTGSSVTGDVTVVGGDIRGAGRARFGGEVVAYGGRLDYVRRGERIYATDDSRRRGENVETTVEVVGVEIEAVEEEDEPAPEEEIEEIGGEGDWREDGDAGWAVERGGRRGRADFVVTTGNGYNRVEGLPITFGPSFETPGRNPFRLRINGIFRTESGPGFGPERWGYHARAEQLLGGRGELRLGGTVFHTVDPIEDWHLSKLENGLSTFFLHRDYRDHFRREGGSVYARLDPRGAALSTVLELRLERHRAVEAGSPWSLFDNDEPWRLQPLAAGGTLHSLAFTTRLDTRNHAPDPSTGWYVQGTVERALRSTLGGATGVLLPADDGGGAPAAPFAQPEYGLFTRGTLDIRRYNRISASSRLNLRLLAGGSLDGEPLPPQRQHALGGEGTLPGFPLFSRDCGARARVVDPDPASPGGPRFYAAYGCDRFVLGQAEYRGGLSFRVDLRDRGPRDDEEEGWGGEEGEDYAIDADFEWVLFADVGRGWSPDPELRDEEAAADVGFGVLLGRLGVYLAVPVTDGADGVNFFIRLNPRI